MKTASRGETIPEEQRSQQRDNALAEERRIADSDRDQERSELDGTIGEIEQASDITDAQRTLLRALRARVYAQRKIVDDTRRRDRSRTDEAIHDERDLHDAAVDSLSDRLSTAELDARTSIDQQREVDREDATQKLWRMLPELDAITTAVNAIRIQTCDRPSDRQLFVLASDVQISAERLLDLIGDILDPRDNRGLYHESGGSG